VPPDGREHRRAPRRPVLGKAVIRGPGLHAGCSVRDLSASGAKIHVSASVHLPPEFNLFLVEAKTSRHVLLKWREGDFAGVAFSQLDADVSVTGGHAAPQFLPSSSTVSAAPGSERIKSGPEKRIAPRRPVLGHCLLVAPGLRANAIIRDVSATGAKVGISSRVKLPSEFQILDPKTNQARRVALKWRRGEFVGVQFCEPLPPKEQDGSAEDLSNVWHV
jgi:hypothetical protein